MDGERLSREQVSVGDAGGIVLGWLTKLAVTLALAGVVLFDVLSIATSTLAVEDDAFAAAREASAQWQRSGDVQLAYNAALDVAVDANPLNEIPPATFIASPDGTVDLGLHREAATLVVHHIGWISDWAQVDAEAAAKSMG